MRPRGHPPVLKRFGQHFLTDQATREAIVAAVDPGPDDTVIEIGPGRGVLTDLLALRPNPLVAIEIDHLLSERLRERYTGNARVRIVEQDVLDVDLASVTTGDFVVVGNVPYYITTPILFHVLRPPLPRHAVFLVQREVAERVTASEGTGAYGALSVNVQATATASIVRHVPPRAFKPPPKVDSAVIKVVPRADPLVSLDEIDPFRRFVQALFGMRRKQIANVLRSVSTVTVHQAAAVLDSLGIDPRARPETLSPATFVSLFREMSRFRSD
jgi:16S rRNA (adenine1518-N6/adenine1519-N6)-dimethyltransferase